MARIRSIKPEFWTSEQVSHLSIEARLLFIGLWNFCDDYGVHPASVHRLKTEVFPNGEFETIAVAKMVDELIKCSLIVQYTANDTEYWHIPSWKKHQKIIRPTGKYPLPNAVNTHGVLAEHSLSTHEQFTEHSLSTQCASTDKSNAPKTAKNANSMSTHVVLSESYPPDREKDREKDKDNKSFSSASTGLEPSEGQSMHTRRGPANARSTVRIDADWTMPPPHDPSFNPREEFPEYREAVEKIEAMHVQNEALKGR